MSGSRSEFSHQDSKQIGRGLWQVVVKFSAMQSSFNNFWLRSFSVYTGRINKICVEKGLLVLRKPSSFFKHLDMHHWLLCVATKVIVVKGGSSTFSRKGPPLSFAGFAGQRFFLAQPWFSIAWMIKMKDFCVQLVNDRPLPITACRKRTRESTGNMHS